ncbi:MAG TPA: selenium-binding protein SBP56-related protein [Gemmatimonadales bacterium]|nr:selenium-binding protein SBP56-related protein [Gemmatimonadales bacterium]
MGKLTLAGLSIVVAVFIGAAGVTQFAPDESVFVKGLKPGEQEKILYVWTRDADGADSDFLAVVDVNPKSKTFGQITAISPTNSPANEAHHFGYTVNADRIFGAGMFTNKLFIYDVKANPGNPKLIKTVDLDPTGYSGPHTMYAVPNGVILAMLGRVGGAGPGALVLVDDDGNFKEAWPVTRPNGEPGYMYDVGIKLEMNRMVTSSWAHPGHVKAGTHPDHSGRDAVVWDWDKKKVLQVVELDAAPLEVRWLHGPDGLGGYTNAAFGNSVWYWDDVDQDGALDFHRVIDLGEGAIPADMRISYDNRFLYISLWGGGKVQQYDIADPLKPKLMGEVALPQPNMMKLTPDSRRLYVTNSLLSSLDGEVSFGAWLLNVGPDGMTINEGFKPDFQHFATGPAGPHDMLLR